MHTWAQPPVLSRLCQALLALELVISGVWDMLRGNSGNGKNQQYFKAISRWLLVVKVNSLRKRTCLCYKRTPGGLITGLLVRFLLFVVAVYSLLIIDTSLAPSPMAKVTAFLYFFTNSTTMAFCRGVTRQHITAGNKRPKGNENMDLPDHGAPSIVNVGTQFPQKTRKPFNLKNTSKNVK